MTINHDVSITFLVTSDNIDGYLDALYFAQNEHFPDLDAEIYPSGPEGKSREVNFDILLEDRGLDWTTNIAESAGMAQRAFQDIADKVDEKPEMEICIVTVQVMDGDDNS